jgi:hypothetical protein
MSMPCPFCVQENASEALVCASCSRDISVPVALINERDDLVRKREAVREELSKAKRALEEFKRSKTYRSI